MTLWLVVNPDSQPLNQNSSKNEVHYSHLTTCKSIKFLGSVEGKTNYLRPKPNNSLTFIAISYVGIVLNISFSFICIYFWLLELPLNMTRGLNCINFNNWLFAPISWILRASLLRNDKIQQHTATDRQTYLWNSKLCLMHYLPCPIA